MDADRIAAKQALEDANVAAFLMAIRACEGTASPDGYRTLFGGDLFSSLAAHPGIKFPFRQTDGSLNYTTAAGAFQFLRGTWDRIQKKLDLPDFGQNSQDQAACELISEAGAMDAVRAGNLYEALALVAPIWASLPGGRYKQPRRSLRFAADAYINAGGKIA
jgi:muramidase (phage lysozyme)